MGTTQSKYQSKPKQQTINATSASYGMSPMAASYADGFRLIKEKPCKHAAGFLKGNALPRGRKVSTNAGKGVESSLGIAPTNGGEAEYA